MKNKNKKSVPSTFQCQKHLTLKSFRQCSPDFFFVLTNNTFYHCVGIHMVMSLFLHPMFCQILLEPTEMRLKH